MTSRHESTHSFLRSKADPERWMEWLLAFCQRDLRKLTSAEWKSLLDDLAALCYSSSAINFGRMWRDESLVSAYPTANEEFKNGQIQGLHTRKDIKQMQKLLKEGLAQLYPQPLPIEGEDTFRVWQVPVSVRAVGMTRFSLRVRQSLPKKGSSKTPNSKSVFSPRLRFYCGWPDLFWLAVAEIIEQCGPRLRQCDECKTLFLRQRRQAYCSEGCSQKVRSRKWYTQHREKIKKDRRQKARERIAASTEPSSV